MPIAKEVLRIGFTVAALPGTYVSKSAVEANPDWKDKVEDGDDIGGTGDEGRDAAAPKGKPQKGV